jgi:hypothetical protein
VGLLATAALILGQSSEWLSLNDPVALLAKKIQSGELQLDYSSDGWGYLRSLLKHLDIKYLTSTSDIVALMTLEHQARMTNLITSVSQQFRRASNSGTL